MAESGRVRDCHLPRDAAAGRAAEERARGQYKQRGGRAMRACSLYSTNETVASQSHEDHDRGPVRNPGCRLWRSGGSLESSDLLATIKIRSFRSCRGATYEL